MTYNMLRNTRCLVTNTGTKFVKFGRTGASQCSVAIDENGAVYTWGQNVYGQSGQGDPQWISWSPYVGASPENYLIEWATLLPLPGAAVKVTSGEASSIALLHNGDIWGWGEQNSVESSAFGLSIDSGSGMATWNGIPSPTNENLYFVPVQCAPGYKWKDIAHTYYYTLGIGLSDNRLYFFGMNLDYSFGMGADYANNFLLHTPTINPYLTKELKMIDAEIGCNCAVTVDNEVYVWGTDWWNFSGWHTTEYRKPQLVFTAPTGKEIVSMSCSPTGVIVALDDGTVWAAGEETIFMDEGNTGNTATFTQVVGYNNLVADMFVEKVGCTGLGWSAVWVIDNNGTCRGFGGNYYFPGSGTQYWNVDPFVYDVVPVLTGVEYEGQRRLVDVVFNEHQIAYQAIDEDGYLWTWGLQYWGPHFATGTVGYTSQASYDDRVELPAVWSNYTAAPAGPVVDQYFNELPLNVFPDAESEYVQPIEQSLAHKPCGHWHLRLFEEQALYPQN